MVAVTPAGVGAAGHQLGPPGTSTPAPSARLPSPREGNLGHLGNVGILDPEVGIVKTYIYINYLSIRLPRLPTFPLLGGLAALGWQPVPLIGVLFRFDPQLALGPI